MTLKSVDPATGDVVQAWDEMSPDDLRRAVRACDEAQRTWRHVSFAARAEPMRRLAELLRERREPLSGLMAREMGKLVREGRAEIDKCALACDHYAESAEGYLEPERPEIDGLSAHVVYEPIGVVLAIMPWNFPFWQVVRLAAPALMAGNGVLLKHSSRTTGCALAIEETVRQAGFPNGLLRTLVVPSSRLDPVLDDPLVRAVSLTGSRRAGGAIAERAGGQLKKTTLELGGSDAYLVLADADVEEAARVCVHSRMINSGQSCIAAKRFVVCDDVRDEFESRVVEEMRARKMGDPFDEEAGVGPLASHSRRDELHRQVTESLDAGTRCLLGGKIPDFQGAYYPPTVLVDVPPGCPARDEELFGPVASILSVADEEEAIEVANDTDFGLGACVFTRDVERGERIARERLDAGSCFVNDYVRSDPRLPFGGVKESGYCRELGRQGIRELVNVKTVCVA